MAHTFLPTTLDASDFPVVLTNTERAKVNGERTRPNRFTERDFHALAGRRSYRSARGEFRTFA